MKHSELKELLPGVHINKTRAKSTHKEADLHLQFCKWIKRTYPELKFVRHEKEGSRSKFNQNLVKVYNTDSGLPDFELLADSGIIPPFHKMVVGFAHSFGLYIEFKRPGESWHTNGIIKPQYAHQYAMHKHLWSIWRCTYFCNDLEDAQQKLIDYLAGKPQKQQVYQVVNKVDEAADVFFK